MQTLSLSCKSKTGCAASFITYLYTCSKYLRSCSDPEVDRDSQDIQEGSEDDEEDDDAFLDEDYFLGIQIKEDQETKSISSI